MTAALSILFLKGRDDKILSCSKERLIFLIFFLFNLFIVSISIGSANYIETASPIFASEAYTKTNEYVLSKTEKSAHWIEAKSAKYAKYKFNFPSEGIIHAKGLAPINGGSVRVNVLEINKKINPKLEIKPQTASNTLQSRVKIKTIADKSGAIAAINGGYFKPQTGVPLGALVIDNELLTGPVYERAAISINSDDTYSAGKTNITFFLKNKNLNFKVDNVNQPRMLSTYTLLYTEKWGKISPPPPKYGSCALIQNGSVVKISKAPIEIKAGDYVLTAPDVEINKIKNERNLEFVINYPEHFKKSVHIISGGPYLVKNGEIFIDVKEEKLTSITGRNPRTLIGYTKDNDLIMATVDGREASSVGMSLYEAAKYMQKLGCVEAINLDGGSSSVMYLGGKITNTPKVEGGIPVSGVLVVNLIETLSLK